MNTLPTTKSLDLGMKLVSAADIAQDTDGQISAQMIQDAAWQKVCMAEPRFCALARDMHNMLHHSPLTQSCELHQSAVLALMAKFFLAGWYSGRQEVMDAEIAKIEREAM